MPVTVVEKSSQVPSSRTLELFNSRALANASSSFSPSKGTSTIPSTLKNALNFLFAFVLAIYILLPVLSELAYGQETTLVNAHLLQSLVDNGELFTDGSHYRITSVAVLE